MELYMVLTVIEKEYAEPLLKTCRELELPMTFSLPARGTASAQFLDLRGIRHSEKSLIVTIADKPSIVKLTHFAQWTLYIELPGRGLMMAMPIKSVGGGRTLAYLQNGLETEGKLPSLNFDYELIYVIMNQGFADEVMDAARPAGARGGTIIHAKGSGGEYARKFLGISIAEEKEIVLIAAKTEEKAAIMKAVVEKCGTGTPASAIAFSVPVSMLAGLDHQKNAEAKG